MVVTQVAKGIVTEEYYYKLVFDNSENLKKFKKDIANDKTIILVNIDII